MNKIDFKKKLKHYTPEIIVGASVIAGALSLAYYAKTYKELAESEADGIVIPYSALDRISSGAESLAFEIGNESFLLKHLK